MNTLNLNIKNELRVSRMRYVILILVLSLWMEEAEAQTCSCAGAPLISSQSFATVAKGNWVFGLTGEYHNISDLYSGDTELENITQERSSSTLLLEVNYGITDRLSLTSTFTFIEKKRTTGLQNPGGAETLTTRGLGDGLTLVKYQVFRQDLWNPYQLSIGAGSKIPIAATNLKVDGLALNADMQPGTGAWDGVGWIFASRVFREANMSLYLNSTFRYTGTNERFGSSDRYKFGNEFVALTGATGSLMGRFSYNLMMKYRSAGPDERNGNTLPGTGGNWLYLKPGIAYQWTDRMSLQVNGTLPLYQYLEGTQPTTSYIWSASLFFSLQKATKAFRLGAPNDS